MPQLQDDAAQARAVENARRIRYITAAAKTLRVRTEHLLQSFERGEALYEAVEAVADEIQRLISEIRPSAEIAIEFRKKWERQKQQLVSNRELEIERYLRQESEAVAMRSEAAAEEEVAAIKCEAQLEADRCIEDLTEQHEAAVKTVVEDWRYHVKGSDQVRQKTVDEHTNHAHERFAAWAADEERFLMQGWEDELGKTIAAAHKLDEEAFSAMENMHKARCSVLEATLKRQQKELQDFKRDYQELLADVANKTLALPNETMENFFLDNLATGKPNPGSKMRRPLVAPPPPSITQKTLDRMMQRRIAVAKAEAQAASDAHAREAVDKLAEFAMKEQEHLLAFQVAVGKVGPDLAQQLQDRLAQLSSEAQVQHTAMEKAQAEERRRAEEAEAARRGRERAKGDQRGGGSRGHGVRLRGGEQQTTLRTGLQLMPGTVQPTSSQGQQMRRPGPERSTSEYDSTNGSPMQQSVSEGDELSPRPTDDQQSPGEPSYTADSMASHEMLQDDISESDGVASGLLEDEFELHAHGAMMAEELDREEEMQRMHRRNEIARLCSQLKETQAALTKGDWVARAKDLKEVADAATVALKGSEAALEAQAKVLGQPTLNDPRGINAVSSRFMKVAEDYSSQIQADFVRVRNMKAALSRARASYARDAQQQHNYQVLEFEDEVLPAVSKLAHEAETAIEVGHAIKRGVDRIPICVIAGAWRRTIAASFPVLKHMWEGAHVEKADREKFVVSLFDVLLRAPGATTLLEQQTTASSQVPGMQMRMNMQYN
eukprot:TRINITY_DN35704_c0_g1_i1.p1 TRINITY_DN35704_c0_g1~~TRINITY_DN35704_c0_g1_i1.p1  ORF type:complete len:774 (-),score=255.86 TRINITY_DN35704_c0_g1_i1:66-2387(-)